MWVKNVDVQGYYLYLEQINLSVNTEYWFKKKKIWNHRYFQIFFSQVVIHLRL